MEANSPEPTENPMAGFHFSTAPGTHFRDEGDAHNSSSLYERSESRQKLLAKNEEGWRLGLSPLLNPGIGIQVPRIIAVGGGKGGVGKSMLCANLAVSLAKRNYRVLLLDFDIGSGNLHTYLGQSRPANTFADCLYRDLTPEAVIQSTHIPSLYFASAGQMPPMHSFTQSIYRQRCAEIFAMILAQKYDRGIDFVFLDLGAGNNLLTMELFCMAHLGLVISQPEPSSIENVYAFLKALLWQLYEHAIQRSSIEADIERFRYLFQSFKPSNNISTGGGYQELLGRLEAFYPQIAKAIQSAIKCRKIGIVVNQVRTHRDEQIGQAIEYVTQKYYGLVGQHWGSLQNDDLAWQALRNRQCLVEFSPGSFMSRSIDRLGRRVVQSFDEQPFDEPPPMSTQTPANGPIFFNPPQSYGEHLSGEIQQWKST